MSLALIVHGGAGDIPDSLRPDHAAGIAAALEAGKQVLLAGGSALDAVVAATVVLEDLPAFNAGYGSVLNAEGNVEMDAGLMDGATLDIGAVAAIQGVKNPIRAARAVLDTPHILFAKSDAERIARAAGVEFVPNESLITPRRRAQWQSGDMDFKVDSGQDQGSGIEDRGSRIRNQELGNQELGVRIREAGVEPALSQPPAPDYETIADTVGAVALDAAGNVAAATSTGGMSGKPPGRVGDAPLPGGGFYADNTAGACSTTGWGEAMARVLLARRAVEGLELGLTPQEAAERAVRALGDRIAGGEGGLIVVGADGRIGAAFNSQRMTHAWWSEADGDDHLVA